MKRISEDTVVIFNLKGEFFATNARNIVKTMLPFY